MSRGLTYVLHIKTIKNVSHAGVIVLSSAEGTLQSALQRTGLLSLVACVMCIVHRHGVGKAGGDDGPAGFRKMDCLNARFSRAGPLRLFAIRVP